MSNLNSLWTAASFKTLDPQLLADVFRKWYGEESPEMAPYRIWTRIVHAYARCGLTKAEDKLVAISGIAKRISTLTGDEYVIGMWRRYLESELLWEADNSPRYGFAKRPSQYRAPSWSWASVDGVLTPGHSTDEGLLIKVLEVDIQYLTEDKTGLFGGASILLKCRLQRLEIRCDTSARSPLSLWVNGVDGGSLVHLDEHEEYFDPALADQNTLFCTPARPRGDFQDILLFQLVDAQTATYRRIGIASSNRAEFNRMIRDPSPEETPLPVVDTIDGMDVVRVI